MKLFKLAMGLFLTSCAFTQIVMGSETTTNVLIGNQKLDSSGIELYSTNLELKKYKKMGIGLATGGLTGGFGINGEFNLTSENALVLGLGRGESYNSFHASWKLNFEAHYLSLFSKVGYAKWFNNNSSGSGSYQSNEILRQVLTSSEIRENKFNTDFVAAGAGIEYNQIEGELSGVNFYGELLIMTELRKSVYLPTGSIGVTYFF